MEDVILVKKEGQIVFSNIEPLVTKRVTNDKEIHLCWPCKHARVDECRKVCNRNKRTIDEYEFITDGYQVFDKDGRLVKFVVSGCSNYEEEEKEKKLTAEDKKRIASLKQALKTAYFDADSVDDANVKQYFQMIRGELTGVHGKVLTENSIINKIIVRPDAEELLKEMLNYKLALIREEYKALDQIKDKAQRDRKKAYIRKQLELAERIRREKKKLKEARKAKEADENKAKQKLLEKGVKENKIVPKK